ncbi:MAG: hypothetical protein KA149_10695 [Chitinophagales bacterium]|nr:hypothetical protein [Chitinophagales bacterium]
METNNLNQSDSELEKSYISDIQQILNTERWKGINKQLDCVLITLTIQPKRPDKFFSGYSTPDAEGQNESVNV